MEDRVGKLQNEVDGVKAQVEKVQVCLDCLSTDVQQISASVAGLVEAWNTSLGVVKFIKWIAAPITVATTVLIAILEYLKFRGH